MNNTLHTPGPWKHAQKGDYDTSGIGIFANNPVGIPYYIATASFMGTADHRYAEANARLIAACPDLLSALEGLLKIAEKKLDQSATHEGLVNCTALMDAREALRKAKGEA
jgi:hypothetical protein